MSNPDTALTLDQGVAEVLQILTGLDLQYEPGQERYQSVARSINRAQRSVALEREWSWYADVESVGPAVAGEREVVLREAIRPRMIGDDQVRLVNASGDAVEWAAFLPRDALHKYPHRGGLWCAITRNTLTFSREFRSYEAGYDIQVPVMREPVNFVIPVQPEDPDVPLTPVPDEVRQQEIDFAYPDLVTLRAAWDYAQTDPVAQPRVQTLEARYKDHLYQIIEREERMTDSPFMNDFFVPIQSGLVTPGLTHHWHPHSDERR